VPLVVLPMLLSNKQMLTVTDVLISMNSVISSDKISVLVQLVQVMNPHHLNHQALVLVEVMVHHTLLVVLVVEQVATNHQHHSPVVLDMGVKLLLFLVALSMQVHHLSKQSHQALKYNNMLLMLKVSLSIKTHKSSVVQLLVVYKHTHKTSKFDFFNHHQFHLQAHSSSKKYAHLNHLHHHLFAFVNKLHLFLNHLHSFFVKNHHSHQQQLLPKLSSVV
jgi:hypothetical protein